MSEPPQPNAYDVVAYPSGTFPTTHPAHLAAVACIHGLAPPPPATARVLELGGGDGMNMIAMAEAFPDARFLNLDLAAVPVARGQAIVAAAGLANVRVESATSSPRLIRSKDRSTISSRTASTPGCRRRCAWR